MSVVNLKPSFVRKCFCPEDLKKVDYFDAGQRGFLLEVRPSGGKTYYQRYTDYRGREHQFKIGPAEILTLRQARTAGRQVVARSLLGQNPQAERAANRNIPSFAQFASNNYLPYVKTYKRSWVTDERLIRTHLLPRIGHLYLDEVKVEHFQQMLAEMQCAGYAPGTCARPIVIARYMFSLARKWKIKGVVDNPASGFSLPPDVQRNRFLSQPEIERLVEALNRDQNQVAAKAILLLLLTGARRNEITQAKWEDVDMVRGTLLVPLSKTGKPRTVFLNDQALDVFRSLVALRENPYVFPSPITGRPFASLFQPWDRIRTQANLRDVRLHDLRHSYASLLINNGVSLYRVQHLLGHSNPKTTQRYAHLAADNLAAAAAVAGEMVGRHLVGAKLTAQPKTLEADSGPRP